MLVPGSVGRPDEKGELHGVLDLPEATFMTKITYFDADTNEELHSNDLGPLAAGLVGFSGLIYQKKFWNRKADQNRSFN